MNRTALIKKTLESLTSNLARFLQCQPGFPYLASRYFVPDAVFSDPMNSSNEFVRYLQFQTKAYTIREHGTKIKGGLTGRPKMLGSGEK